MTKIKMRCALSVALCLLLGGASGALAAGIKPQASFVRSAVSDENLLEVRFDASASTGGNGEVASVQWVFGDGYSGSGPTITHGYRQAGWYVVTLVVINEHGARDTLDALINLAEPAGVYPIGVEVGQAAPQFTLADGDGDPVSLSDFYGHVILVDFWASYCAPCLIGLPRLYQMERAYRDRGLVLVPVSVDRTEARMVDALTDMGVLDSLHLWGSREASQEVKALYGVLGIPHTFLIDRKGVIRFSGDPEDLTEAMILRWL
ncbi:redoxin domain-containing protein [Candidatus Bipolaricaulota bacterium]|nr:redoxin domain-containing protein [Candidatus Bipolaricaulota bacterium]